MCRSECRSVGGSVRRVQELDALARSLVSHLYGGLVEIDSFPPLSEPLPILSRIRRRDQPPGKPDELPTGETSSGKVCKSFESFVLFPHSRDIFSFKGFCQFGVIHPSGVSWPRRPAVARVGDVVGPVRINQCRCCRELDPPLGGVRRNSDEGLLGGHFGGDRLGWVDWSRKDLSYTPNFGAQALGSWNPLSWTGGPPPWRSQFQRAMPTGHATFDQHTSDFFQRVWWCPMS